VLLHKLWSVAYLAAARLLPLQCTLKNTVGPRRLNGKQNRMVEQNRKMNIVEQKKALRKEMFAKRNALDATMKQVYDQWICAQLKHLITERNFRKVHVYIPMGAEIDIVPLISWMLESGIVVVSPKTLPRRQLENRILVSLDQLETGVMGTRHPLVANVYEGEFDCVIVPGLAIDAQNYRLGYGGGYYDTFLAGQPNALKIGIYYPVQLVGKVPSEPHDLRLDIVLMKNV
jgi:5-formyltetrahydrofolate cyclo-ligase